MPTKKATPAAFLKMEAKVAALEGELSVGRSTLVDVHNSVNEYYASLIALLEKFLGKSMFIGEGSVSATGDQIPAAKVNTTTGGAGTSTIREDALTEFLQSVKKVELPTFNGEDPVGWISRAEIYFRVQNTSSDLK